MAANKTFLDDFSAKVQKIFIELHDYSFFHSPSEIDRIDKRFVGRERIYNKLKIILENSETKSGAYLITGFRGMGKTSYVNKVISSFSTSLFSKDLANRFWRLFFLLIFILFFTPLSKLYQSNLIIPHLIGSSYLIFFGFWLFRTSYFRLIIEPDKVSINRFPNIFIDFSLFVFITELSFWIIQLFSISFFGKDKFWVISGTFYSVLFINCYCHIFLKSSKVKSFSSYKESRKPIHIAFNKFILIPLFYSWGGIKRYINYSRRIYIRINFSYDDLKEIDILRLVARNIKTRYDEVQRSYSKHFLWITLKILLIFSVSIYFYNNRPFKEIAERLKKDLCIEQYFPSQNAIYFDVSIDTNCNYLLKHINGKYNHKSYYIDMAIQGFYQKIRNIVECFSLSILNLPYYLNYIILFYLSFVYLFTVLISRLDISFFYYTHVKISKRLNRLNDLIESQLSDEKSITNEAKHDYFSFNFNRKFTRQYQKADEREIEKYLIEILEDIRKVPRFTIRPEFIFIFDELDKIEPQNNSNASTNVSSFNNIYTPEGSRVRQQALSKLMSNLKYFLNSAKAKFIFIAGREIYDAALADISDRHFFWGSIFHEIIYVDSFFTDSHSQNNSNLSNLTEEYVCRFIIPQKFHHFGLNLKGFRMYLNSLEYFNYVDKNEYELKLARLKKEKIIITIYQFINYLTLVSNGSPKKITFYFEKFIETKRDGAEQFLLLSNKPIKSSRLYLTFDYRDKYKIGLIHYLKNPFYLYINKNIREYSDKLIVSTSFLIDHLFKFHRFAFSWRNIELVPELVDINKTPELRNFIFKILQFLLKSHIEEVSNGLFQYRFNKKISAELSYLSKVSEEQAAAYNFTLDESLALKEHFKQMLKNQKEELNDVYSLVTTYHLLGDLYYYDEELTEAIYYYNIVKELVNNKLESSESNSMMLFYIRNLLKLGLAHEKRKTFNEAYMIYEDLIKLTIKFSETNANYDLVKIRTIILPILAKVFVIEKISFTGFSNADLEHSLDNLDLLIGRIACPNWDIKLLYAEYYNNIGDAVYYKNSQFPSFEGSFLKNLELKASCSFNCNKKCTQCLMYLKSLERFANALKYQINDLYSGITFVIQYLTNADFKFSHNEFSLKLLGRICSNIGDCLFSKFDGINISKEFERYFYLLIDSEKEKNYKIFNLNELSKLPLEIIILVFYRLSGNLYYLANSGRDYAIQNTKIIYFLKEINPSINQKEKYLKKIKKRIIKPVIKAHFFVYENLHNFEIARLKNILNRDEAFTFSSNPVSLRKTSIDNDLTEIVLGFICLKLKIEPTEDLIYKYFLYNLTSPYNLCDTMYNRTLRLNFKANLNYLFLKSQMKYYDFDNFRRKRFIKTLLTSIVDHLKTDYFKDQNQSSKPLRINDIIEFCIKDSLFCYNEISNLVNGFGNSLTFTYSFKFKIHKNFKIWCNILECYKAIINLFKEYEQNPDAVIRKLIKEINLGALPDDDILEYEFIKKLANIIRSEALVFDGIKNCNITNSINKLFEHDPQEVINVSYQRDQAISNGFKAKDLHRSSSTNKGFLNNLHFLNDDFNDNYLHFAIAKERYLISSPKFITDFKNLIKLSDHSSLYKIKNYLDTAVDHK